MKIENTPLWFRVCKIMREFMNTEFTIFGLYQQLTRSFDEHQADSDTRLYILSQLFGDKAGQIETLLLSKASAALALKVVEEELTTIAASLPRTGVWDQPLTVVLRVKLDDAMELYKRICSTWSWGDISDTGIWRYEVRKGDVLVNHCVISEGMRRAMLDLFAAIAEFAKHAQDKDNFFRAFLSRYPNGKKDMIFFSDPVSISAVFIRMGAIVHLREKSQ